MVKRNKRGELTSLAVKMAKMAKSVKLIQTIQFKAYRNIFVKIIVVLVIITNITSIFSISQKAIEYYSAGELSYKTGDYATALKNYELALTTDPSIEGYDTYIKFKMGISAYMIGNYDKARSYLSGYNSSFVRELLSSIDKRQAQDEWKRWIMKNKPTSFEIYPTNTGIKYKEQAKRNINLFIPIIIFILVFLSLILAELRIMKIKRHVIELPPINAQKDVESIEKSKLSTQVGEQKEQKVVGTSSFQATQLDGLDLLPENAKIINFEKLLNSEIDIFKDIFENTENIEKVNLEEFKETKNVEEFSEKTEKTIESNENIEERAIILEDLMNESKNIIQDVTALSELKKDFQEGTESIEEPTAELSETEKKYMEKLKKYLDENSEVSLEAAEEMAVEELEKLQKDFKYFDDLDKITEEESKLIVKKLILLSVSENN